MILNSDFNLQTDTFRMLILTSYQWARRGLFKSHRTDNNISRHYATQNAGIKKKTKGHKVLE